VFSLDPAADSELRMALISRSVISVPWEPLRPGPIGDYLEVIDLDPASHCVYEPIDLDHGYVLAQDGLAPSTGSPQFHQQMVYAVAMKTIVNFEQVLGRKVMWAERSRDAQGNFFQRAVDRFVPRLRIYPHALRAQNAFYSPSKVALLFGYFHASTTDPRDELPGGVVFSCLSHDIIVHETTHAILDGMHRRLLDVTNPDMPAFHEAFADIVAIFQHFTLPGVLLDQIQRSQGNLSTNNVLAKLATQFARSTGRGDALRNALGEIDENGRRAPPDPSALGRTFEPHARGAILVAAIFDAFLRIYDARTADLKRIATNGTGVLPTGEIHPDLARRLAGEAIRAAQRVLDISIRAIDYLPPVDITFGDYFRALITADADFYPDDVERQRLAFIEAFRNHGIYPRDVRTLAEETLRWQSTNRETREQLAQYMPPDSVLRTMAYAYDSRHSVADGVKDLIPGDDEGEEDQFVISLLDLLKKGQQEVALQQFLEAAWQPRNGHAHSEELRSDQIRLNRFRTERLFAAFLHGWIEAQIVRYQTEAGSREELIKMDRTLQENLGLSCDPTGDGVMPPFEVHAVRPTVRLRPDGRSKVELLVVLTQTMRVRLADGQRIVSRADNDDSLAMRFRGGCTLIIDPEEGRIRYAIRKNIASKGRLNRQREFLQQQRAELGFTAIKRFGLIQPGAPQGPPLEPFAVAHAEDHIEGGY